MPKFKDFVPPWASEIGVAADGPHDGKSKRQNTQHKLTTRKKPYSSREIELIFVGRVFLLAELGLMARFGHVAADAIAWQLLHSYRDELIEDRRQSLILQERLTAQLSALDAEYSDTPPVETKPRPPRRIGPVSADLRGNQDDTNK